MQRHQFGWAMVGIHHLVAADNPDLLVAADTHLAGVDSHLEEDTAVAVDNLVAGVGTLLAVVGSLAAGSLVAEVGILVVVVDRFLAVVGSRPEVGGIHPAVEDSPVVALGILAEEGSYPVVVVGNHLAEAGNLADRMPVGRRLAVEAHRTGVVAAGSFSAEVAAVVAEPALDVSRVPEAQALVEEHCLCELRGCVSFGVAVGGQMLLEELELRQVQNPPPATSIQYLRPAFRLCHG